MLKDKWLFLLALFTAAMIAFSIIGGFKNYSPIPYWDMWDGTLFFYHKVQNGDHSAWWAQHNEHRIVLARILFWIDYKFFSGLSVFLIIVNYILVAFAAWVFWLFLRESSEYKTPSRGEKILGLFLVAWTFLWTQESNFTWAFQSQFFLAQSIPLFSLYWLVKSTRTQSIKDFSLACFFGVISITTMANGVLALPLMLVYSLILRQGRAKNMILFGLSAACLAVYFYHYESPAHHGKFSVSILENPIGVIHYTLLYLGSPFHYLLGKGEHGKIGAVTAGGLLLIVSTWIAYKEIFKLNKSPKIIALLIFILYITGTALGTAGGRLILGLNLALSSRYTTPAIMAFAALAIIMATLFKGHIKSFFSRKAALVFSIPFCTMLLTTQAVAFKSMLPVHSGQSTGALALSLNIPDDIYIKNTFYNTEVALLLAKTSQDNNYSIFGSPPYAGLLQQIEKPFTGLTERTACIGAAIRLEAIPGHNTYLRIHGWVHEAAGKKFPQFLRFVDENNLIIGFAVTGARREDKFNNPSRKVKYSGFTGYILSRATGEKISLFGDDPSCKVDIQVSSTFISPLAVDLATIDRATLGPTPAKASDVTVNDGWTGSDFQRTAAEKIQVLGSFRSSDADTGSITLRAQHGSRFFFKSGPSPGRQYIEIMDTGEKILLPYMTHWSLLELSRPRHQEIFDIKIFDSGNSWGEWSAIAIESN